MDEEEERLKNEAMLLGQLRRDSMLPEQQAPQAPIAPAVAAPAAQVLAVEAPEVEAPLINIPIAPDDTIPEASYTMPDESIRNIFPESSIPKGAVGSAQENFRQAMLRGEKLDTDQIQRAEAFAESMGTTFDPVFGYSRDPYEQSIAPRMASLRPVDPRTGEFLSQSVIAAGENAGLTFPSQVSVPMQQAPQAPIAPMGPEETRARMGGMTLNGYLNAPAGTEGVSGLRTDPQGRMISSPAPAVANNFAPQASGSQVGPAKVSDEIMSQIARPAAQTAEFRDGNRDGIEDREQGIFRPGELLGYDAQGNEVRAPGTQQPVNRIPAIAQPPASELSDFEKVSLARQQRIGGTGSYAGDSQALQDKIRANERLPGESQADRDTRVAQGRTTGGQTVGMSFDDARRRAEGQLAARGVRNPRSSQVNALARSIQAAEPGRLAEAEAKRQQDAYDRALSIAAEARRVAAEERAVAAEERAVAGEGRAVAREERTIAEEIAAQKHAAKSQEQRDREILIKEQKLKLEIAELTKRNPTEGAKATEAETFMDKNNLIFDNGVLYEKQKWGRGEMIKVTNPVFMDMPGMEFLRQKSMGPTGNTPVDYSVFSVRAVGTPAPTTVTAPPAPTTVTVPPVIATNNTVTQEALNGVSQPAVVDPSARRAGETETSYRQRLFRELGQKEAVRLLSARN
jgi:hypothetical protein